MKYIRFLFTLLIICSPLINADATRDPQLHEPGLLVTNNAVALQQSDFNSGTKRITQSGYYYLTEDIKFEPDFTAELGRTDKPRTGWFTALSIESDNVILDLNAKTLEATQDFVDTQTFKVFSIIELSNSPFPHFVFAFPGETTLKHPNNVTIKNGTVGRSPHHGIHGNNNANVQFYDLVIRDWEVAGISLNALKSAQIRNITISGLEHTVPFTGLFADMNMAKLTLEDLVAASDPGAQQYLDDLNVMIADDNQNGKNNFGHSHDGNTYGIFINRTVDVGPIVTHCDDQTANCVTIQDVTICNITTSLIETVGMFDGDGNRVKGETFGAMRWLDAYSTGTFAPNAFAKAQAYGKKQNNLSDTFIQNFADNILGNTPNEATFTSQVTPAPNADFAGHTNKGAFGIRLDCAHGVKVKNCCVQGITNLGALGQTIATLPGGPNYPSFTESRYTGNDVYGISLSACHNCEIADCFVTECHSENGRVHGISLINGSDANRVQGCTSSDHFADLDNTSTVNPASKVYGFYVDNESNANKLLDCISQSLEAPRFVYGFLVQTSKDNLLTHCCSLSHAVSATANLDQLKQVAGFASIAGECNVFGSCQTRGMRCTGEDGESALTKSRALGFLLGKDDSGTADKYSEVTESEAACNNGGSGTAVGILLDSASEASVTKNTAYNNHAETSSGKGYGIQDTATATTSLFLKNLAYGSTTLNYSVNFVATESLPLTACLYGKIANMGNHNSWNNVSLEHAPGSHYTGDGSPADPSPSS